MHRAEVDPDIELRDGKGAYSSFSGVNISKLNKVVVASLRNPHLWIIAALTGVLTFSYYADHLDIPSFIPFGKSFFTAEYIHDLHRALFLIPMLYAATVFWVRGAVIISLVTLCIVLPRSLLISVYPDPAIRAVGFVALASLAAVLLGLERDREHRLQEAYRKLDLAYNELKSHSHLLRTSEERYRDLFESASEAIIIIDLQGNIIEVNRAAITLFGYPIEELVGMNMGRLLTPDSLVVGRQRLTRRMRGEAVSGRYEGRLVRKDRTEAIMEVTSRVITADGQPVGVQIIARDISEERRLRDNMRFYIDRITTVQEEERKRIARELHDETAQALAALSLNVEAIIRAKEPLSEETLKRLEQLQDRIDSISEGVRRFSHELRPGMLDQLGLLPALEWLADNLSEAYDIEATVEVLGTRHRLSDDVELVLFRIAQEALSNVRRHSKATKAQVRVEFSPDKVKLVITDNGKGFELPDMLDDLAAKGGLGILGMQERARVINADFSVDSEPGKGTIVTVEVVG
jgi:PAS domain S-box-containing protein